MLFIKFGKFLAAISSNNLSVPFSLSLSSLSGMPTMCLLVQFMVSHRSLRLCSLFFSFFFLFFSLNNFKLSYFRVHWFFFSSGCSNMPLNPSSEFLISVTVLFRSRITFWFLFDVFYLFIDISILLIHRFLTSSTYSFRSLIFL